MELTYSLAAGAAGGLATSLVVNFTWPLLASLYGAQFGVSRLSTAIGQLTQTALHAAAGCLLGLLFWLSWGLTAIVEVPWFIRGLAFGGLSWIALPVPVVGTTALWNRLARGTALAVLFEWLCTCALAGLACAWMWAHAP